MTWWCGQPLLIGIAVPSLWLLKIATEREEPPAMQVTTIGLDLAKQISQVHGVGPDSEAVLRKPLRRADVLSFFAALPPCLV